LNPLVAADDNGRRAPITLIDTMKSAWRIVGHKEGPPEIRQVLCRPDFDEASPDSASLPFKVSYIAYKLANGQWRKEERSENGLWKNDGAFPVAEKFP
jgi:hypothetical protein